MFNLLFPIFCFGVVISGIVFLGLQQASDLAKYLAANESEIKPDSRSEEVVSQRRSLPPVKLSSNLGNK
jgi:hypothetical protein